MVPPSLRRPWSPSGSRRRGGAPARTATPRLFVLSLAALTLLTSVLSGPHPAGAQSRKATDPSERPFERWREGPVRYIITSEEDREYKELKSEENRSRFIETFWARRDPNPRTLINEYRREFWDRVVTANTLFSDSSKPGWKTDMGRYYILLGPPDDRDTSLEQGQTFGRTGIRGAIVWRYRRSPGDHIGTGLTLVFTVDASGEWRVAQEPTIVEQVLSGGMPTPLSDPLAFGIPLPQLPPRITEMQLLLDLGRLETVPSTDDLLTAIVTAEEFYGVIPFSSRYDIFAGQAGRTIVALTLNLHPNPLDPDRRPGIGDYLIVGRLDRDDGTPAPPLFLKEQDFHFSAHNARPDYHGPWIYQAVVTLDPGRYRIAFAAYDRHARVTGTYSDVVDVPAFGADALSLSSLCLSEMIEPVQGEPPVWEPYVIGHLKVTPRLIPTYRNGDLFAVYYQIYTEASKLDIEYQFLVRQGNDYVPIGNPIVYRSVSFPAQGWSFPLRDWPASDFKLRVTVSDPEGGGSASREIGFKVL